MTKPTTERWGPWETHLGDLIDRAFGPKSSWATSFHYAGYSFGGPNTDGMSPSAAEAVRVKDRNDSITAKLASARGVLKAIDQELERRGVQPAAQGIARRDFGFIASEPLRAIATRDHEELRATADRTTKAAAILAGSVIEAVLIDALARKGFKEQQLESLTLFELIHEAALAMILPKRTEQSAHAVRDLRNFVHPAVELREGRLRDVDTKAAIAVMNMVLEDLA